MLYIHPTLWREAFIYNKYFDDKYMCKQLSDARTYNEKELEKIRKLLENNLLPNQDK